MALRSDMSNPLTFQRGDIIAQRFEVVQKGSESTLWIGYRIADRNAATGTQSPTEIHIKILRPELCTDSATRAELGRVLRQLQEHVQDGSPRILEVVAIDDFDTIAILLALDEVKKWEELGDRYEEITRVIDSAPQTEQAAQATSSGAHLPSPVAYGTPAGGVNMLSVALLQAPPRPPAPELLMDESVAPGSRVVGGILFMALVLIGVLLVVQGRTSSTGTPTGAPAVEGKNLAVLFATTRYDDTRWPAPKTPQRDAQEVATDLRDLYGFSVEKIEDSSIDDVRKKLRGLAAQSYSSSDQLLIMFFGQGDKDEILQKGWIIARDSKSDDRKSAYVDSELREDIDNIPCPHILLILDVSVGGTFDPNIAAAQMRGESKAASAAELVQRQRRYRSRLYLSSVEQKAEAAEGHEHSPFTWKLLEALRSGGGEGGVLTWNELLGHLEKLDPAPRGGTFPKSPNSDPGGDFLFIRKPPR